MPMSHERANGLGMGLGNLSRISEAQTRSISAESFTGEKGRGGKATDGAGARCACDAWFALLHGTLVASGTGREQPDGLLDRLVGAITGFAQLGTPY
jgi:hypothetical protein